MVLREVRTMSWNTRNTSGIRTGTRAKSLISHYGTRGTLICAGMGRAYARAWKSCTPESACSNVFHCRVHRGGRATINECQGTVAELVWRRWRSLVESLAIVWFLAC